MKLMGYDYEVIYKHDKDNVVTEALSRRDEEVAECEPMAVSRS